MFKTILVPIDDSEGSRDVAGAICKMVADWRCRVIFVNVVDTAPIIAATSEAFVDPKGVIDEMRRVATRALSEAVEIAKSSGLEAEYVVREGNAIDEIVNVSQERGVDAIVMASHGRHGLARALLGSVTEGVLRKADVPVVVVRWPQRHAVASPVGEVPAP